MLLCMSPPDRQIDWLFGVAGASLLPGAKDGDGRKKAITGKGAASPILGAVELGLKAQALVTGRDKKRENKAEEKPAVKAAVEQVSSLCLACTCMTHRFGSHAGGALLLPGAGVSAGE